MTRFSDDYDPQFNNEGELWWANCYRALRGKKGQRDLRELLDALEAMPEKRLISGNLVAKGEVCTVGALVVARREKKGEERTRILAKLEQVYATCECLHTLEDHPDGGPCRRCAASVAEQLSWEPQRRWSRACEAFEENGYDDEGEGVWDTIHEGVEVGLTKPLAYYLAYVNDEVYYKATPEERYEKVVAWVRKHLTEGAVPV